MKPDNYKNLKECKTMPFLFTKFICLGKGSYFSRNVIYVNMSCDYLYFTVNEEIYYFFPISISNMLNTNR